MLSHRRAGCDVSFICVMSMAARNGRIPKTMFMVLYLPYRFIIHLLMSGQVMIYYRRIICPYPAKNEPPEMQTLLGNRCRPFRKISEGE